MTPIIKKLKFKKRLLCLFLTCFLILCLSIPCFASTPDHSDTASIWYISGKLYFNFDTAISYLGSHDVSGFTMPVTSYTTASLTGLQNDPQTVIKFLSSNGKIIACRSYYSSTEFYGVDLSTNNYLVVTNCAVSIGSSLYNFLISCVDFSRSTISTYDYTPPPISNDIVSNTCAGFNGVIGGFGSGVADFFGGLFLKADGGITPFALFGMCGIGIGLAIGVAKKLISSV